MATRIAWLLNFDANLELQAPESYRPSPSTERRRAALISQLFDLVAPDDLQLDLPFRGPVPAHVGIQTFCPTPSALKRIAALGLTPPPAPSLAVLRRVNNRRFCAALGHGLPQSHFALDMTSLEEHLKQASFSGSYVIKRAFSFAGREQRRVHQGLLDDSTRGFCLRSFARGEGLQIEPWVERVLDFSRHAYLTRSGCLFIGPLRAQSCDAMGRFMGMLRSERAFEAAEQAETLSEVEITGQALTETGYFGPFGIDGFRYRTELGTHLNRRCEINARLTMGFPRGLLLQGLSAEGER